MQPEDFTSKAPGQIVPISDGTVAFVPNQLPPQIDIPPDVQQMAEQALLAIGEFRGLIHGLPNPNLLAETFVRREAVLSSQIEGTKTELGQLFLFEIGETDDPSLLDKADAQEVFNYVVAHNYAVEKLKTLPICERLLKETHARLFADVRGQETRPGQYRKLQNFIGRSPDIAHALFVPPPPEEVPNAMRAIERFIQSPSEIPILIRFALIHYQFEAIHPFEDGNGRLGRLLLTLLLTTENLLPEPVFYLSSYFIRNRRYYYDNLLAVSQEGTWLDWIRFFLIGIEEAASDAVWRSRLLLNLREAYRERFQRKNAGALLALLDSLFQLPVVTNRSVCRLADVSYNAAQRHINTLMSAKVLSETTGRARNRVYMADEVLRVLQDEQLP